LDSIFFRELLAVCQESYYDKWFNYMATCIPDGMRLFHELEVRHVWWESDMEDEIQNDPENR
jgi:hypothetical protein